MSSTPHENGISNVLIHKNKKKLMVLKYNTENYSNNDATTQNQLDNNCDSIGNDNDNENKHKPKNCGFFFGKMVQDLYQQSYRVNIRAKPTNTKYVREQIKKKNRLNCPSKTYEENPEKCIKENVIEQENETAIMSKEEETTIIPKEKEKTEIVALDKENEIEIISEEEEETEIMSEE